MPLKFTCLELYTPNANIYTGLFCLYVKDGEYRIRKIVIEKQNDVENNLINSKHSQHASGLMSHISER